LLWSQLRHTYAFKKATLIVTSPGYDAPEFEQLRQTPGVVFEQQRTQGDMMMRLADSDGIFMVNTLPETFGCVQTMAEIAGRPCWALCGRLDHNTGQVHFGSEEATGGLREVLANPWSIHTDPVMFAQEISKPKWPALEPARDYRMSKLLPQWLDVLGLSARSNVTTTDTKQGAA